MKEGRKGGILCSGKGASKKERKADVNIREGTSASTSKRERNNLSE